MIFKSPTTKRAGQPSGFQLGMPKESVDEPNMSMAAPLQLGKKSFSPKQFKFLAVKLRTLQQPH